MAVVANWPRTDRQTDRRKDKRTDDKTDLKGNYKELFESQECSTKHAVYSKEYLVSSTTIMYTRIGGQARRVNNKTV